MTNMYDYPIEWKTDKWWRNRTLEERQFHLALPPRLVQFVKAGNYDPFEDTDGVDFTKLFTDGTYKPGQNLIISGPPGSGKSTAAAYIAQSFVAGFKASARWVVADGYVQAVKDSWDDENDAHIPYYVKTVKASFDLIVLDALGEERSGQSDFAAAEIATLLRGRYDSMRSVIVTTNLDRSELVARYPGLSTPLNGDYPVSNLHARE